jgi:signal transduction histidine kinase
VRTQISRAIVGVALLLVLGLGVPLAIVVQRFYDDQAVADLHRRAAESITEIVLPLDARELAAVVSESDAPGPFTVYDASGRRVFGHGPATADAAVRAALAGDATTGRGDGEVVVAAPLTQRTSEAVVGAVRVTQDDAVVDAKVRRAWLAMVLAVGLALLGAVALARSQGRRLAEPIAELARHAEDLGRGEFGAPPPSAGIPEIDTVATALSASGERLASILARERGFSAEVAHQLRTPLTGLRLRLERLAAEAGASPELGGVLDEVSRLEGTVEHLLALSRDRQPSSSALEIAGVLDALATRWASRFDDAGRRLVVDAGTATAAVTVRGSFVSVSQILDVLVDNGLRHGAGDVRVRARAVGGGTVVEVTDDGPGIPDPRGLFDRAGGDGHGIGLGLARRIAEAEGGRLLLATAAPVCFHLVLAPHVDPLNGSVVRPVA